MTKVSLSALRENFIRFTENPSEGVDMSTLRVHQRKRDGTIVYCVDGLSIASACGLKKLGSGMYSDVYAIDDKRCIKVVKERDAGYERFVQDVVRKLPGNKYLPRIYYQGDWAGKRVYIMERLDDTSCYNWRELPEVAAFKGNEEKEDEWYYANQDKIEELAQKNRTRSILNNAFRQALETASEPAPFMVIDPELVAVAKLLRNSQCHNDIHSGNVMFRGDVPVVTDPAAG